MLEITFWSFDRESFRGSVFLSSPMESVFDKGQARDGAASFAQDQSLVSLFISAPHLPNGPVSLAGPFPAGLC